ncbi:MAG: Peptidyl-tRNA hydrolase [Candidatus Kaiserbacteria bacterium GW2011_GWB1_52_6]|uniref:Peptidyl-tRNA hydrolase n=3 Tax=Candidatus Kaiseribacteriota TaxID=1752734 RepID=A0A0G1ZSF8_9BACT|nr:MAG: Peptidyl-tRNA hydrolase [Candidatus Kaiserbacteria bacterium GW2011_GWA2_52_12]KKW28203.1 MAG: Peptidyl-tRNA hydrolase [Candidatus Kaiserbacteria bacterium GW2011_GWB1_52_6]KKW31172.1 MAG: Peptidyl-tRNA hydrolase [Candidatus Kaiserbacteria bacterium GW2011_GWC2_52_8b]
MAWVIVGLGNPGDEYANTRHNTGRMALEFFAKTNKFNGWHEDKKSKSIISTGLLEKIVVALVAPETFMNKSGSAISKFIKNPKAAERLVVIHDDLDLPLGTMKLSFDRGSGGHKGLESVMRAVKTKKFTRVRIGVSPSTASGTLRKPQGEKVVNNFILTKFKAHEMETLHRVFKRASDALRTIIVDGPERAMNEFNTSK